MVPFASVLDQPWDSTVAAAAIPSIWLDRAAAGLCTMAVAVTTLGSRDTARAIASRTGPWT